MKVEDIKMNDAIIRQITEELKIKKYQVEAVLALLEEGNTIPFIARYRKEKTGSLDEEQIRKIQEVYAYQQNLLARKEDVIRLIDEKNLLTEELRNAIYACQKLVEVEDLYRPFKEKKKTKATEAIALGVEPLAKQIMAFPTKGTLESIATPYLNDKVLTVEDAIQQASYIIAEWISDRAKFRKEIRRMIYREGVIVSKVKKGKEEEGKVYEMYFHHQEAISSLKPHRFLAMNRGEKEGILNVKLDYSQEVIQAYLEKQVITTPHSFVVPVVKNAIQDSLKRLILPSVEREIHADLKEKSEEVAIWNFASNVEHLLLTPPIKGKTVLGFDPAFRTGCKLAVLDPTGKVLAIEVIYPTEPHLKLKESEEVLLRLINQYHVDVVAIGNGTASRESEQFVASVLSKASHKVEYIIVSEAGASVYSASKLAIEEFPDLTVEKRSAISIGRRLQDALSELVKIDPKSIGVGLYQHDVNARRLDESLTFVVEKTVNQVGVNINTASSSLLKYVSGLTKRAIDAIIDYRNTNGKIPSREVVASLKGMTPKIYEQAIGFLRIPDGENPLDKTGIHPESYDVTRQLLAKIGCQVEDIGTQKLKDALRNLDIHSLDLSVDDYTLEDIIKDLQSPLRDPRDMLPKPLLRSDILKVEDLKIGEQLQGTVRNVVDFGVFVDIGLHNDGLIHISHLSKNYVKHPSDIVHVGDILDCYVLDVKKETEKVSLSLIPPVELVAKQG